jgi:glyoxylase-like metal-dependent hydrolase (beta-lactamase superfamily II)
VEEIVAGLHRLQTPMTSNALPWVMPYAFEGADGVTLFDSGYGTPEATEALTEQLDELGYAPSDVRRLIVSHAHPDHLGMAGWLREQSPDYELVMFERESDFGPMRGGTHGEDWMRRSNEWLVKHGIAREEIENSTSRGHGRSRGHGHGGRSSSNGGPEGAETAAEATMRRSWSMQAPEVDVKLSDGEVIEFDGFALQAVWTPGHTPGHLCMYEPNHKLMFTGDHILSRITPNVSVSSEDEEWGRSPLAEFRASLAKCAEFDISLALPAHEDTIEDLPKRCDELLEHHDHRMEEVLAGIGDDGPATASDISAKVTWNKPYETFDVFKKRSALGETLSHLQLLADDLRVRRIENEVVRWERL